MLKLCTKTEFDSYADFAYELAINPEKSAYPTYCDGVKTKDMFVDRIKKTFERETEEVLLFEYQGEVEGLIHYYWIPEDNYIATCGFNIRRGTKQALSEFISMVEKQFKGYDLFLGFPANNHEAIDFFKTQGFECIEDDYNNTAFLDKINSLPNYEHLIRITKDNYESFKILHDQIEGDMYWNSERILANLDEWVVFVEEKGGVPVGAVYYLDEANDWFEIFGIDLNNGVFDKNVFKNLLCTAVSDVKKRSGKIMTFFCSEEEEKTALECGFTCVGRYLCYKKHIA